MNPEKVSWYFLFVTFVVICHVQVHAQLSLEDKIAQANARRQSAVPAPPISVRFVLSARGLPSDVEVLPHDYPDGYVKVVYFRSPNSDGSEEERTEVIDNSYNPEWNQVFEVHYIEGFKQRFVFTVMDEDIPKKDDVIGKVEIGLKEIVEARDNRIYRTIIGKSANSGVLQIDTLINYKINDNTVRRLSDPSTKATHFGTVLEIID